MSRSALSRIADRWRCLQRTRAQRRIEAFAARLECEGEGQLLDILATLPNRAAPRPSAIDDFAGLQRQLVLERMRALTIAADLTQSQAA